MRKFVFLLALALLFSGCEAGDKPRFTKEELSRIPLAQRTNLPEASGGFVLAVGDETITADEVIAVTIEQFRPIAQSSDFERFEERARPGLEQILTSRIANILLYQQAKRQAGEQVDEVLEKAAEAEVRKFVVSFEGDYARAEKQLKQMGMDWQSFKEYQKKMIISQNYIAKQLPEDRPIPHSELLDYYNQVKDEFYVTPAMIRFRLIDIEPAGLEVTDPNKNRQQLARELANELIGRIQAGGDFGELALAYSHGHRRAFGGLWRQVQPGSLAAPYDILGLEAEKLKPGQIAGPIEAGGHIFIMRLEEKQLASCEPFEKVQKEIEARIILDRRKRAVDELEAGLARQAALGQRSEFIDFCLKEIYRKGNE